MRKINTTLMVVVVVALLASLAVHQIDSVSAQTNEPVGIVVEYMPEQSITIVDQSGNQHYYMLSASLKILPAGKARELTVGSFVTIIAPASLSAGKETAVGIVIHPHVPNGWKVPVFSATPLSTATSPSVETATSTATGELPTESPTGTITDTPVVMETVTVTETSTATPEVILTETPTATAVTIDGSTSVTENAFVEWLRQLLQQVLGRQ